MIVEVVQFNYPQGWSREQIVAVWRSGRMLVLSYFPLFAGLRSAPTQLWDAALSGPLQAVQISGPRAVRNWPDASRV